MSDERKTVSSYARAERRLCDDAGPLLIDVVREIEQTSGIRVLEIRVTIEAPDAEHGWAGANCVIVREATDEVGPVEPPDPSPLRRNGKTKAASPQARNRS
ncbi:MAG TPA: hypothetical protein VGK37_01185 [Casimicrobiaceae bacterium]|jgi:hypothetical protein